MNWAFLAIVSAIFFGIGDFIVVYSQSKNMDVTTLYITYTILIGVLNLLYIMLVRKQTLGEIKNFKLDQWAIVLGMSVFYLFAYLMHFVSIQKAPNPGYANALVMFHVIVLTGLSYLYLSKPLNWKTIVGIGLMFAGAALVTLYSGGGA